MTIFGWDASHYDGVLDLATLRRAAAEGIAFFTHKLGEGLGGVDNTQATALAAARDAGITIIGGYWFCHGEDDPAAEARKCIAVADQYEPWWKDFPGWFWQPDCETEAGHKLPTEAWIEQFADELVARSGRPAVAYASRGQYGDRLAGLRHPLWNADYGANPHLPFRQAYPGDGGRGWTRYSGQTPLFWQFGSNTTIAGRTTCDANAYRGTLAQLTAIITGGSAAGNTEVDMQVDSFTPAALQALAAAVRDVRVDNLPPPKVGESVSLGQAERMTYFREGYEALTGEPAEATALTNLGTKLDALAAAVAAHPGNSEGGTLTVDDIRQVFDEELARGAQAEAAALAPPATA